MQSFPLILCADDYGLSPAVSAGILEALAAGRLNATGAMTNQPNWKPAARDLHALQGRGRPQDALFGVHLNLTMGKPLTGAAALASSGSFPQLATFLRGRLPREALVDVTAEIRAQLDAFEEAMGRAPDFIDGHQHVHVLEPVRGLLLDEAQRRGYAGKVWLRDSADRPDRILRRGVEAKKALALAWFGRGFAKEARARGFEVNEGFSGFSAFDAARDYGADFARYLAQPGARHLVMCHPGHVDEELKSLDPVTTTREQELAFLLSDGFAAAMEKAGARLGMWTGSQTWSGDS
ncbi:MAG: ChbG/HpnK family deacetylase [Beijerinckiaceae bacterium]|nr:ChbG/HpnK family deacetylase [Beijerinckiaceae bacterium]